MTGWDGAGCDIWVAECDGHCFGCNGYGANNCLYCADHASRDWNNDCVCDPGWSGPKCEIYSSTTYHTNVGECDPRCFGGCTGPTNMDCVRCCDHAHLDVYGACICDSMWGGVSCNMYQNIPCDARCAGGCSGPSNFDCVACSVHATFNQYGACVCDDYWHGND